MVKAEQWLGFHTEWVINWPWYEKNKAQLWLFVASSESVKDLRKWQTVKEPQLVQMDKVLHEWFTACSMRKPMRGPTITEKLSLCYKGQAIPLQVWAGPEGSRRLRLPDFMTTAHEGGKFVSPTDWPPLPPRKYSWHSFLLEAESTTGP